MDAGAARFYVEIQNRFAPQTHLKESTNVEEVRSRLKSTITQAVTAVCTADGKRTEQSALSKHTGRAQKGN